MTTGGNKDVINARSELSAQSVREMGAPSQDRQCSKCGGTHKIRSKASKVTVCPFTLLMLSACLVGQVSAAAAAAAGLWVSIELP